MKRILSLLLVLLSSVTYSQVTDNDLTTQNNNNIFTMGFNPTRHGNMFESIINSKINKRTPLFLDSADITKRVKFNLSGLTTGTTRNVVWPNKSGTVAFLDDVVGGSGVTYPYDSMQVLYGDSTWRVPSMPVITVSSTTLTLDNTYFGKIINATNASGLTITVPAGLQRHFSCGVWRASGSGTVTLSASGTTLNGLGVSLELEQTALSIIQDGESDSYIIAGAVGASAGNIGGSTGPTDNAILVADGANSNTLKASGITVESGSLGIGSTIISPSGTELVVGTGSASSVNISGLLTPIDSTSTSYTLTDIVRANGILNTNASAITVTLPSNMPLGYVVVLTQEGAGTVSITAGSNVVIHGKTSTTSQYDMIWVWLKKKDGGISYYVGR